ncbi:uncharacterized protein LOC126176197 isoform X2 [Schistocerca cancellata]|uniref:uncharacterized protein LOC126176197 isoform X2 n=1 Tax=Schistocerca cancellata TaxID=274614 RepID=UPI002119709C|nr:uncharacterized protein LOC126176197 isoform X2 [Schistocerca cancellata]
MTSTPREGRPWSWRQLVFFLLVVVTPLMFSAALATPVQPDEDEEFAPIERIFWGEREDETKTSTTPKSPSSDGNDKPKQLDPWSLVWYIGSFGGLVAFFLAVSCSECCCHKPAGSQAAGAAGGAGAGLDEPPRLPAVAEGPPPPPYSMFAPPPYDSLCYGVTDEKDKLEVFVVPVPVHSAGVSPQSAHTHSYSQSHSQPP